nr:hypothetical protein [Mangrovicoccus ximenensis]
MRRAALAVAALAFARQGHRVHLLFAVPAMAQEFRDAAAAFFAAMKMPIAAIPEDAPNDLRRRCYGAPVVAAGILQVATDHLRDSRAGLTHRSGARYLAHVLADGTAARQAHLCGPLGVVLVDSFADVAMEAAGRPVHLKDEVDLVNEASVAAEAMILAMRMRRGTDFDLAGLGDAALTAEGRRRAERLALSFGPAWAVAAWREKTIGSALTVLHGMNQHKDYAMINGVPKLSDPARAERLSRGSLVSAASLVQAKAGDRDPRSEIVSEVSLSRVLNRYRHLAGVSAPAPGLGRALWQVHALTADRIASLRPVRRGKVLLEPHADDTMRWRRITERVRDLSAGGGKVALVAPFASPSQEALLSRLPSELRAAAKIAVRAEEIEDLLASGDMPVLFAAAETARWRVPKMDAVWRARPGADIELHAAWDDPAIAAVRGQFGLKLRKRLHWPSARLVALALSHSDRLERRAAARYRAARMRWETAMEQAFGFTGNND